MRDRLENEVEEEVRGCARNLARLRRISMAEALDVCARTYRSLAAESAGDGDGLWWAARANVARALSERELRT